MLFKTFLKPLDVYKIGPWVLPGPDKPHGRYGKLPKADEEKGPYNA